MKFKADTMSEQQ